MFLFSSLQEQIQLILFGEVTKRLDRIAFKITLLEDQIVVSKAEVLAAIEELKSVATEEKEEVVAAITAAITAATAPLEQVILDLKAQIEAGSGAELGEILAAVTSVAQDIETIVDTADADPDETLS